MHSLLGGCHIAQVNRSAVRLSNNQPVILVCSHQLSLRLQQEAAMRTVELPGSGISGAVFDRVGQVFQGDIAGCHGRGIRFDANGRLCSVNSDLAHAWQNADTLADLRVGVVVKLPLRHRVADDGDIHDRLIVGIGFSKRGRTGKIDRQLPARARNGRLYVGGGAVEAFRKVKLQYEARVPLDIVRGDHLESGDLHELPFEWRGDVVCHSVRRCARIVHLDLDDWVIDCRQVAHGQSGVRNILRTGLRRP